MEHQSPSESLQMKYGLAGAADDDVVRDLSEQLAGLSSNSTSVTCSPQREKRASTALEAGDDGDEAAAAGQVPTPLGPLPEFPGPAGTMTAGTVVAGGVVMQAQTAGFRRGWREAVWGLGLGESACMTEGSVPEGSPGDSGAAPLGQISRAGSVASSRVPLPSLPNTSGGPVASNFCAASCSLIVRSVQCTDPCMLLCSVLIPQAWLTACAVHLAYTSATGLEGRLFTRSSSPLPGLSTGDVVVLLQQVMMVGQT